MKCNRSLKHQIDDCGRCNLLWIGCQERAADLTAMKKTLCPSWTLRTFLNSVLNTPRNIDICGLFLDSCCILLLYLATQLPAVYANLRSGRPSSTSQKCLWSKPPGVWGVPGVFQVPLKDAERSWKYLKVSEIATPWPCCLVHLVFERSQIDLSNELWPLQWIGNTKATVGMQSLKWLWFCQERLCLESSLIRSKIKSVLSCAH